LSVYFPNLLERLSARIYSENKFLYQNLYYWYKGLLDRQEVSLLEGKVRPGSVAVDLGANIGFYSQLLAKLVGPQGEVHAFEPDKQNFSYLRMMAQKYPQIKKNNCAVGKNSGKINLFLADSLNVDHLTYDNGEKRQKKLIKVVALDDYFKQKQTIDVLKVDIQGFDYFAILGAQKIIKRSPNILILGELSPYSLAKAGSSVKQYLRLLRKWGFRINYFNRSDRYLVNTKADDPKYYCNFWAARI
jgi:FkbM family methyltransferase